MAHEQHVRAVAARAIQRNHLATKKDLLHRRPNNPRL